MRAFFRAPSHPHADLVTGLGVNGPSDGVMQRATGMTRTAGTSSPARITAPSAPFTHSARLPLTNILRARGSGVMRSRCRAVQKFRLWVSALLVASCAAAPLLRESHAQDTTMIIEGSGMAATDAGAACGCRPSQAPPWHGNLHGSGDTCRACCPPHGKFHANPCGQLALLCQRNRGCAVLPPCFPRLHAWCAEGSMPTPRPPTLPRCHQCGAPIEGGF